MTMFCLIPESSAKKEEIKLFTLFVDAIHNLNRSVLIKLQYIFLCFLSRP